MDSATRQRRAGNCKDWGAGYKSEYFGVLTADRFEIVEIQKLVKPPKNDKWGSLKSLENLLALRISPRVAHQQLGPLFATYDLRLGDAHLSSKDLTDAAALLGIEQDAPHVMQGYQLVHGCVNCIYFIIEVFKRWKNSQGTSDAGTA